MAAKKKVVRKKGAQLDPKFDDALSMSGAEFHSFRNSATTTQSTKPVT